MNLLNSVFVKYLIGFLLVLVIGLGVAYFWRLNGRNVTWCVTHSRECQLARLTNVKEVAEKTAALEGGK